MWKWIIGLLVIIVLALGAWKMGWFGPAAQSPTAQQTATTTPSQQQVQSGLPTAQSDTSDAALSQDSAAIDSQLSGMSQDSAAVNSSLNDQPTQQSF